MAPPSKKARRIPPDVVASSKSIIKRLVQEGLDVEAALLVGSYAEGTWKRTSDVDVLTLTKRTSRRKVFTYENRPFQVISMPTRSVRRMLSKPAEADMRVFRWLANCLVLWDPRKIANGLREDLKRIKPFLVQGLADEAASRYTDALDSMEKHEYYGAIASLRAATNKIMDSVLIAHGKFNLADRWVYPQAEKLSLDKRLLKQFLRVQGIQDLTMDEAKSVADATATVFNIATNGYIVPKAFEVAPYIEPEEKSAKGPSRREDLIWCKSPDDSVVIVNSKGTHHLNYTGAEVWLLCDGSHGVEDISRRMASRYGVSLSRARGDCNLFLQNSEKQDLLVTP